MIPAIYDRRSIRKFSSRPIDERDLLELMDGASIQNLLLAATDKGIGSLWICDIYFAYPELSAWLGEEGQLVAAVALGYPEESPAPRPRKPLEEILRWRR